MDFSAEADAAWKLHRGGFRRDLATEKSLSLLRTCSRSAALRRYSVKNKLKMLMYHSTIPLFHSFSPCLALARETVNRLLERLTKISFTADETRRADAGST
ncbi:hypothetical protein JOS77_19050 [Chromobacterium haemolyticum]|nr:hypothetical protein JOS77_19050 [Chromobacterium haemolyticum]